MKKLLAVMIAVLLFITLAVPTFAAEFKPSSSYSVNILCGFEQGDWMPMLPNNITALDTYNGANIDCKVVSKNTYSGSKAFEAVCNSENNDGGYCTFEWYQMEGGKHIYVRDGRHTELTALYNSGKGLNFKNAEYLQFYVKNPSKFPMSIKWLSLYGEDYWSIKVMAKHVTYLLDGEWEKLAVNNEFITIPSNYEGFVRVALVSDNFKSGAWDGKPLNLNTITAFGGYFDVQSGQNGATLYIDDVAIVGKNVNAGMGTKIVNEADYFKGFIKDTNTPAPQNPSKPTVSTPSSVPSNTSSTTSTPVVSAPANTSSEVTTSDEGTTSEPTDTDGEEKSETDVTTEVNENENENSNILLMVIIAAGALVVIAGVVVFIVLKSKKK